MTVEFAELLRSHRLRLGLTQEELAHRSGVSARALSALENGRRVPRLSTMHILAEALGLSTSDTLGLIGSGQTPAPEVPAPAQLPAEVGGFVGRESEMEQLDRWAGDGVPVVVVSGAGGVGKTAMALRWAHRQRDRFPDGQLYLHMRGFDHAEPVSAREALSRLLSGLGVRPDGVPSNVDDAAALFRSLLADRRMIVFLDNVRTVDQVRPLLPGTDGNLVLVTGRHHLPGLVALHGAAAVSLDVLSRQESAALLGAVAGAARLAADPGAVDGLAYRCGDLPLALRIVGARVASLPMEPLAAFVAELESADLWSALAVEGDAQANVLATFELSFRALSAEARRLFLLLGLIPGEDFPAGLARAIGAESGSDRVLAQLTGAHLLERHRLGRFRFHDLIRQYALHRADRDLTTDERSDAIDRLIAWCETADAVVERANLPAVVSGHAGHRGIWRVVEVLNPLLIAGHDPRAIHPLAAIGLAAAESEADPRGVAMMHNMIAGAHWSSRDMVAALTSGELAVQAARDSGDDLLIGRHLANLGVYRALGSDYHGAETAVVEALAATRRTGNIPALISRLDLLAEICRRLGRYAEAKSYLVQCGRLLEAPSTSHSIMWALVHLDLGEHREGLAHAEAALATADSGSWLGREALALRGQFRRHLGEPEAGHQDLVLALALGRDNPHVGESSIILVPLAESYLDLGDHAVAFSTAQECLKEAESGGNLADEAAARRVLTAICTRMGDLHDAVHHGRRGVELCQALGDALTLARTWHSLAEAHTRLGEFETGQQLRARAIEAFKRLGVRMGQPV